MKVVVIGVDRLAEHFLAGAIEHVQLHQIFFAQHRKIFRSQLDRLALPRGFEFVYRRDRQLRRRLRDCLHCKQTHECERQYDKFHSALLSS